jgi:hypothetical protein
MLNYRQTDIQTVQTIWICFDWKIKSMRVVSSVLRNGLHINALMSCCKETWAGDSWRTWGGGMAGKPWPVLDLNEKILCVGARVMGVFSSDCSLEGGS